MRRGVFTTLAALIVVLGVIASDQGPSLADAPTPVWHQVESPAYARLNSLSMVNSAEGWAVGDWGTILHYVNGTWKDESNPQLTLHDLQAVYALSQGQVWAVGWLGPVFHYSDGQWYTQIIGGAGALTIPTSIYMVSNTDGWLVACSGGTGPSIFRYDGTTWSAVRNSTGWCVSGIYMVSADEGWAVGGDILHYRDGSWASEPSPTTSGLDSVFMVSPTEGWAVGSHGTILHYDSGTWSLVLDSPTSNSLSSVYMVSSTEGWAIGSYGTILHYNDGSWSLASSPTTASLRSVHMVSSEEGWAVGGGGTILHYHPTWRVYLPLVTRNRAP